MSIFKDTFTDVVQNQLKTRGDIFLQRTPESIIYINGRAAWIRMTSGVNIGEDDGKFAKDNILQGGSLDPNTASSYKGKGLRLGVGNQGVNDYSKQAYSSKTIGPLGTVDNLYGLRPMPGITSLDVSSLSAYGSVRQATINFNCWDVKQLELLELLYMRPGFMTLVEWGWMPYLNNNGQLENNPQFYDIINSKKPLQQHLTDLYLQSQKSYGNSEGILGYIKNYEWSARPDGGYDCRTEIISTGEIMESLKVNYSVNYRPSADLSTGLLKSSNPDFVIDPKFSDNLKDLYERNIVAGLIGELVYYSYNINNNYITFTDSTSKSKINLFKSRVFEVSEGKGKVFKSPFGTDIQDDLQVYIDLESLTQLLSYWVVAANKDENGNKTPLVPISTKRKTYDGKNNSSNENLKCLSHPLQISVDPTVCLVKNLNYSGLTNIKFEDKPVTKIDTAYGNAPTFKSLAKRIILVTAGEGSKTDLDRGVASLANEYYAPAKTQEDFTKLGEILSNAFEEYKATHIQTLKKTGNSFSNLGSKTGEGSSISSNTTLVYVISNSKPTNNIVYETTDKNKIASLSVGTYLKEKGLISYFPKNFETFQPSSKESKDISQLSRRQVLNTIDTPQVNQTNQDIGLAAEKNLSYLSAIPDDKNYFIQTPNGEFGQIGNIFVNLSYLIELSLDYSLESNDVKEKKEINLYDFLKKMMNGIQGSLGSLNNFDIHTDPVDGVARIIDINYVDEVSPQDAYNNAFTFLSSTPTGTDPQINGLFNNVRSYSIRSQIFKDQTSIVAISAQNGGGQLGIDNETLVGFNKGITNRILPDILPPTSDNSYNTEEGKKVLVSTLLSSLTSLLQFMKDLGYERFEISENEEWDGSRYNLDNSEKYKNALRDLLFAFKSLSNTESAFKSIIPTIVSLELDGIGGLIIGNMFRLPNNILPAGYKSEKGLGRKLGYIITKLGHKVSNNDWTTQIDAQTIILESPDRSIGNNDLDRIIEEAKNGVKVSLTPSGEVESISGGVYGTVAPPNKIATSYFGEITNSKVPKSARALLDAISYTEGTVTRGNKGGYDIMFGNNVIPNWSINTKSGHPKVKFPIPGTSKKTTAAGRYQFVESQTWVPAYYGDGTFSKDNQDLAGYNLIRKKRNISDAILNQAYNAALKGVALKDNKAFQTILDKISGEWASVADSKGNFVYNNQKYGYQSSESGSPANFYNLFTIAAKAYEKQISNPALNSLYNQEAVNRFTFRF